MEKAIVYNRCALIFLTVTTALMYAGPLDLSDDAWGMIFFLFTPPIILAHFLISLFLERRKPESNFLSDYLAFGTIIILYALCILIKGFRFF